MDSKKKEQDYFISIVTDLTFLANSTDWDSEILALFLQLFSEEAENRWSLYAEIYSLKPKMEFASLVDQISSNLHLADDEDLSLQRKLLSLFTQIISLVNTMDLDLQPKPKSKLISLVKQIISLFHSKPDSESELVSLITQTTHLGIYDVGSHSEPTQESELISLISQLVSLKPEPELTSLITRIISRFRSMNWEPLQFISLSPQTKVELKQGIFCQASETREAECNLFLIKYWRFERQIHFHCGDCNGEKHEGYEKTLVQAKHTLHPQHSLQLVYNIRFWDTRKCYCCDENLQSVFYHCGACDYGMNLACAKKPPPLLFIDHPRRHQHPLSPFPSHDSLTCHLCAIKDSTCLFYICPPCAFVVHQKCLSLPHVIRISRHPHRISFTPFFDKGDWFCSVCRKKINNDYGGYSCIKDGCLYAAHSKCATQSNVWDGIELEGVPEDTQEEEEEVLEPFVQIADGIIQHFSHPRHFLVKNSSRDYEEIKMCQACIMPIYFGKFYSCITCEFILHEECANLSRKIYHATHPHRLRLVRIRDGGINYALPCAICDLVCTHGLFYMCEREGSRYKLHVQCALLSEPLVHGSHVHHLFLTNKPRERRACSVCQANRKETFNCIEECKFSLCFRCATIPQKVRYKHDKHMLSLCHGEETVLKYWCEACEKEINPRERFYKCDEYCCVTLHIECLIGKDLYIKPGSSCVNYDDRKAMVLANDQHMSRPICYKCKMRCPFTIAFQYRELIYCSIKCLEWWQV